MRAKEELAVLAVPDWSKKLWNKLYPAKHKVTAILLCDAVPRISPIYSSAPMLPRGFRVTWGQPAAPQRTVTVAFIYEETQ